MATLMVVDSVAGHLLAPSYSITIEERRGFTSGEVQIATACFVSGVTKEQRVTGRIVKESDEWILHWKGTLLDVPSVWMDANDQEYLAYSQALVDRYRDDGTYFSWKIIDSELSSRQVKVAIPSDIPRVPPEDYGDEDEELLAIVVVTGSGIQLGVQNRKRVLLANLRYPYGRHQIYMPGPLVSVGACLMEAGYEVSYLDLNMEPLTPEHLQDVDGVGISPMGAPYIPSAIDFVRQVHEVRPELPVILGGQAIEGLTNQQVDQLFGNTEGPVFWSRSEEDFSAIFGETPDPLSVSHIPAWGTMDRAGYLERYLGTEMCLEVSQGCRHSCVWCAASKGMREVFRDPEAFERDLRHLARIVPSRRLRFYVSSLDVFQTPETMARYLEAVARVAEYGIDIQMRALSCVGTFIKASEKIPNFGELLHRSGLTTIGVGVDGSSAEIWKAQRKTHNKEEDILRFVDLCGELSIQGEALMVVGVPEDTRETMAVNVEKARVFKQAGVTVRPYCAKQLVPGNDGWEHPSNQDTVAQIIAKPELFYNLDFAALGSEITHPDSNHRRMVNEGYANLCWLGGVNPLMPQGNGSLQARAWNSRVLHDR